MVEQINALTEYNPKAPATFGNATLVALVQSIAVDEEAEKLAQVSDKAKSFIGMQLTRAVLDLAEQNTDGALEVNPYLVFEGAKDVARLNENVLIHFGVLNRAIDDTGTKIVVTWVDPTVGDLYDYTAVDKEKNAAEYNRRFRNRKALNQRLSDAYKAVCTLRDNKNTADDLVMRERDGETEFVLKNPPKQIGGGSAEVVMGGRKPVNDKATASPTLSSIVSIASAKHKKTASKGAAKGEPQKIGMMGMTDAAFGEMCNTLISAINKQEGKFSPAMVKHMATVAKAITAATKK